MSDPRQIMALDHGWRFHFGDAEGAQLPAFDDDKWELYEPGDWTQSRNIAAKNPAKLAHLQRLFLIEAVKYNVLPLDDRRVERFNSDIAGRPTVTEGFVLALLVLVLPVAALVGWLVSKIGPWVRRRIAATVSLMVIVLGFFLPPVSIILMTAPIILPPLKAEGFDLIWFGIIMSVMTTATSSLSCE